MCIDVKLLGRFDVRVHGRTVAPDRWSRRHAAALVKLLAITPGRSLHREQVIDALWPDLALAEAAPRLHKASHYARRTLDHRAAVVLAGETVRLFPHDDVRVDVMHFRRLAEAAIADGSVAAAEEALAVYGGQLLPLDVYEPWAEQAREHLDRLHLELLRQARAWHQVLATDPVDEHAHLALMRRFAENGHRAAALRQFDWLRRVMRHELGLEPSPQALALRRQIVTAYSPTRVAVGADGTRLLQDLADLRRQLCAQIHQNGTTHDEKEDDVHPRAKNEIENNAESERTSDSLQPACCG
jgi:DNA-binding SARP family transcriptional activator